ncbi:ferrous iron transport protein A [Marichromatium gracile]|uniref:Iron transporter FeoA n=2 Tax=Marichromatium TaxID=85076 RepID=W0DWS0_MARPU|nr:MULTISPECIES: FeoA family protein [Marichromatium]MBO8087654.1 ferrous iron transport protein A [Marichromatium sp.]AHF02902.1 iron transporter FeoA [Marichromatium purpuratum 984]KXX65050.1 iron transporter FeoA [Marichromatium gracile]MBK1710641.1 ferrous iron transport protein A [Marichromatium gracile]MCF1182723.1 ferrous iron transport protein A [Marichromatium gracile]
MNTTLKDLVVGDHGAVRGYRPGADAYRRKLLSMGLTPGAALEVVRVAPMGDPVEVRVRGTRVTLRREEAAILEVERA